MKQHITPEQLSELTPEKQQKLQEWWKPQEDDLYFDGEVNTWEQDMDGCIQFNSEKKQTSSGYPEESWEDAYPLLSIGQMIEFLDENQGSEFNITRDDVPHGSKWLVFASLGYDCEVLNHEDGVDGLCDALWEAVKESLKTEVVR